MALIWSTDPWRDDNLFNSAVWAYLTDYFRDRPRLFQRLYGRMWQRNSIWIPSFSVWAMLAGPAWFGYRRHYVALGITMPLSNTLLMIMYFSDSALFLAVAVTGIISIWVFCGLYGRSVVMAGAARFISRTAEEQAEPLLQRRAVWRAGGIDHVTGTGMMVMQATMLFPMIWELVHGPILLWPLF
ncbi:MAG: hypothetical protein AAF213_13725 [Pseudomonadota bacterium]